jgi:uncharacterized protein with von Willebrand factor type A (vWA) domain
MTAATPHAETSAEQIAVSFTRVLRGAGLVVPVDSVVLFVQALGEVSMTRRDAVYWAGRATLVRRFEDIALYDKAFRVFWEQFRPLLADDDASLTEHMTLVIDDEDNSSENDEHEHDDSDELHLRFSRLEVLRDKDFRQCTPDELAELDRLIDRIRLSGAKRQSLRLTPTRRGGTAMDMRRTVRGALARYGEPLTLHRRTRSTRFRRLVVLLDISGSMEPYARALVRFMHGAVVGRRNVEAFVIGTRLTRITRELTNRDPNVALTRAGHSAPDWSGGTRLGDCLRTFNDRWGTRGMARGADVVILSDGWDRGEPALLAEQMARLAHVAHRIVWVNPLKVTPGYAPLARGMAAALPHVDVFCEGHSLASLEQLATVLSCD